MITIDFTNSTFTETWVEEYGDGNSITIANIEKITSFVGDHFLKMELIAMAKIAIKSKETVLIIH